MKRLLPALAALGLLLAPVPSALAAGPPLLEALGAGALDFGPTGDVPPLEMAT